MVITSSDQKALLFSLFYVGGTLQERRFAMEEVPTAARCLDKLRDGATITRDGQSANITIVDGDVEFAEDEAGLLRDLLSSLTEASPTEYRLICEVKQLLAPLAALQAGEGEGS